MTSSDNSTANRVTYPSVSAIVDEFRKHFGDSVHVHVHVHVKGGAELLSGKSFGWNPPPSPNCDSCTGHDGNPGCERMDRVVYPDEKPDPANVFCGFRLSKPIVHKEQTCGKY